MSLRDSSALLQKIPIDSIDILGHLYDREEGEYTIDASLYSLSSSIENKGLIQPIVVAKKSDGRYTLMVGKRRLGASKILRAKYQDDPNGGYYDLIDAIVTDLSTEEGLLAAIDENDQRRGISTLGGISIIAAAIAQIAGCIEDNDTKEDVIAKGTRLILHSHFRTLANYKISGKNPLPCEEGIAIKSVDQFVRLSNMSVSALVKKTKLLDLPKEIQAIFEEGLVTLKSIGAFHKAHKKNTEKIDEFVAMVKQLGVKKTPRDEAKEAIEDFINNATQVKHKKMQKLGTREYNSIKRRQDGVLKKMALLDSKDPRAIEAKKYLSLVEASLKDV